jgi:hypothetical protein
VRSYGLMGYMRVRCTLFVVDRVDSQLVHGLHAGEIYCRCSFRLQLLYLHCRCSILALSRLSQFSVKVQIDMRPLGVTYMHACRCPYQLIADREHVVASKGTCQRVPLPGLCV